ncbi:MAG: dihydrodipicolinate synthase family protein [Candidatus Neomarinimicrobiota bacterium]
MTTTDTSYLPGGVFAAALTPLLADLSVDTEKYIDHCRRLLTSGCDGLAVMGTTGEANSFTVAERMAALEALVAAGIPPRRLLVGTGVCAFPDTVTLTRHALSLEVGGVLLLPPFYYKNVSDDGVFAALAAVIDRVDEPRLQVYLYHFPQLSAVPFGPELVGRLLKAFPGQLAGMKDSGGDWEHMLTIQTNFPDLRVFAGTERFLNAILGIGGAGCISATTNIGARLAAQVYANPGQDAVAIQARLIKLRNTVERYPMIPALKQIMFQRTSAAGWLNLRPPHVPLLAERARQLIVDLDGIGFPEGYGD